MASAFDGFTFDRLTFDGLTSEELKFVYGSGTGKHRTYPTLYQLRILKIMAIVLALLIVGWLVAFALGNQAGFNNEESLKPAAPAQAASTETTGTYSKSASVA